MPEKAEQQLRQEAEQKFPADTARQDTYVYGALRHKLGWKPVRIKKTHKKAHKEA